MREASSISHASGSPTAKPPSTKPRQPSRAALDAARRATAAAKAETEKVRREAEAAIALAKREVGLALEARNLACREARAANHEARLANLAVAELDFSWAYVNYMQAHELPSADATKLAALAKAIEAAEDAVEKARTAGADECSGATLFASTLCRARTLSRARVALAAVGHAITPTPRTEGGQRAS